MTPRKKADEAKPAKKKTTRRSSAKKTKPKAAAARAKEEIAAPVVERIEPADAAAEPVADASQVPEATLEEVPQVDKMVAFFLGGQRYGLPIDVVQEIQQIVAFSEVPAQGGAVVGMVNLRGAVIPAVDMRVLMGLPDLEYTLETPMVITRRGPRLVALVVDEVEDVVEVPRGCLQSAPAMHALGDRMLGVCRFETDLVYLLDVERLLGPLDVLG
ncbi:MAG: chemotaxis protein CheW [Coriobacteriia bacterium]|nr:chemotaxis protein CheW [Coriobacteriia bacterium]